MMKEDILRYLKGPYRQADIEYKSAYMSALVDARISTGRNETSGEIINPKITGSWSGALVYMVLIDHIGSLFVQKNKEIKNANNFINALQYFSELTEKEIYALYALRCSFAHDYFLFNIPSEKKMKKERRELLIHNFTVTANSNIPLIILPKEKWSGLFNEMTNSGTTVNLEKLGNLVENIHSKLIKLTDSNELEIIPGKEYSMVANYIGYLVS